MAELGDKWECPDWMLIYLPLLNNTGGNRVEELMNDHTTTMFSNAPRATLILMVAAQVDLLWDLHLRGLLGVRFDNVETKPLPTIEQLGGSDPDFTGGMSTQEYMDHIRERDDEATE